MKKALFIFVPVLVIAVFLGTMLVLPGRFRLESRSPSGDSNVKGLRFQGQNTHALDETLRLFVSRKQSELTQQTSIPWCSGLSIEWK